MNLNILPSQKLDVICELCGSPLNEQVNEAIKNYKPDAHPSGDYKSIPKQNGTSLNISQPPQTTPFPRSAQQPSTTPSFSSPITPFSPRAAIPPIDGALLVFPQINKQIKISPKEHIFYFGRNTILPLVSPVDYDVEWLNSISRVKKDKFNRIIHQHFIIRKESSGQYSIEDNQSRWGTWVNRQQIKGRGHIPLINGDKIELMLSKPGTKKIVPFEIIFYATSNP
ncbi:MAG: hypothetical protein DRO88_06065 [Promethearchaeia archaeon]|nr:MAG: hypothetical protein DRO88_06065 [Candidatus Lokiarchaeia archaeon]